MYTIRGSSKCPQGPVERHVVYVRGGCRFESCPRSLEKPRTMTPPTCATTLDPDRYPCDGPADQAYADEYFCREHWPGTPDEAEIRRLHARIAQIESLFRDEAEVRLNKTADVIARKRSDHAPSRIVAKSVLDLLRFQLGITARSP